MPNRLGHCHPNQRAALDKHRKRGGGRFGTPGAVLCAKDGCRAPAAWKWTGNVFCRLHAAPCLKSRMNARREARKAARGEYATHKSGLIAGDVALREVLEQLGGGWPPDLAREPLFADPPGDNPGARAQAQADLARAWMARENDGGAAWRAVVRRLTDSAGGVSK